MIAFSGGVVFNSWPRSTCLSVWRCRTFIPLLTPAPRANTLPLKVRDPLHTKSVLPRPVRTHSAEHPSPPARSCLRWGLEKALWVMICHHLFAYGAWHLMAPAKHTHVRMCARGCSPASGHWADRWEERCLLVMINRDWAMDSCWRVISDIQDDFALIRQLSFGKIKEMLCSVFTFSTMH